jgi:hypothetical protein
MGRSANLIASISRLLAGSEVYLLTLMLYWVACTELISVLSACIVRICPHFADGPHVSTLCLHVSTLCPQVK